MSRKNRLRRNEAVSARGSAAAVPGALLLPSWLLPVVLILWFFFVYRSYLPSHPLQSLSAGVASVNYPAVLSGFLSALPGGAVQLLMLAMLVVLARGLGGLLLRAFSLSMPAGEYFIFSLGLGFGGLAYIMLLLGALGLRYGPVIFSLFIAGTAVAAYGLRIWTFRASGLRAGLDELREFSPVWRTLALIGAMFCLLNAVMALVPEIFYDSHVYHLAVPEHYLLKHRLEPMRFLSHSNFPLNMSMLYSLALALGGETLAKMLHCLMGLLTVSVLYLSGRRIYDAKTGLLAALIFCSAPIFATNSWTCGNDVGLAFFFALAYVAYLDWAKSGSGGSFALMSVLAGVSMGVKYTAAFCVAGLGAAVAFHAWRVYGAARAIKRLLLYSGTVFLLLSPWLVKNYVFTGNPVQPFLNTVLGGENLRAAGEGGGVGFNTTLSNAGFKIMDMLLSPWTLTHSGTDSLTFIGPVFLLLLPCLILAFGRADGLIKRSLLLFGAGYAFWYMGTTAYRYILQLSAVLALCLGWAAGRVSERSRTSAPLFAAMFAVNFGAVLNLAFPLGLASYFAKGASRDEFLSVSQASYPNPPYAAIKWCNENLPKEAKALFIGESRPFRMKRDALSYSIEINAQPLMAYLRKAGTPDELYDALRADKFTHLLINYREAIRNVPYREFDWTAAERGVFDGFWRRHAVPEYLKEGVYVYRIADEAPAGKGAPNILEGLEKAGWTYQGLLKTFVDNGMWASCLDEYGTYARYGYDVSRQMEHYKALLAGADK